jgi:hypothetical protein
MFGPVISKVYATSPPDGWSIETTLALTHAVEIRVWQVFSL